MRTEYYIAFFLFLVAAGVVLLNDKLKSRKAKNPQPAKKAYGWKTLAAAFALVILIFVGRKYAPNGIQWLPYLIIGFVLLFVLFTSRKGLWLLIKSLCSGKRPLVIYKDAEGSMTAKCPKCANIMQLNKEENRLECSHCEETLTFVSDCRSPERQ